jgi:stage V sporulation protein R
MVWEYFVKSRKSEDYRQMLFEALYHPPRIEVVAGQPGDGTLHLNHLLEGKPLVSEYLANTMLGLEYLWGAPVVLETSDAAVRPPAEVDEDRTPQVSWTRVRYRMQDRQLSREKVATDG